MRTHYAGCDKATESDPFDYWDEFTACGLQETESRLTDIVDQVTCKNCIKAIGKKHANQRVTF